MCLREGECEYTRSAVKCTHSPALAPAAANYMTLGACVSHTHSLAQKVAGHINEEEAGLGKRVNLTQHDGRVCIFLNDGACFMDCQKVF